MAVLEEKVQAQPKVKELNSISSKSTDIIITSLSNNDNSTK